MTIRLARVFSKLTLSDTTCFIKACGYLVLAALIKTCIPLRWYAPWLGEHHSDPQAPQADVSLERLQPIVLAIDRAVRYSPIKCKCLVHALCSHMMLRTHGLPSDFYLGVDKNETREVIAHAWVKSGQHFIAGKHGHKRYTVISVFSHRPATSACPP